MGPGNGPGERDAHKTGLVPAGQDLSFLHGFLRVSLPPLGRTILLKG